jgi:diguanylate cyclase (GGDEF)-like protein
MSSAHGARETGTATDARSLLQKVIEITRLTHEIKLLRGEVAHWQAQSKIDPLTGALNRRGWEAALVNVYAQVAVRRVSNYGEQQFVLFADVDHFKSINDQYGHAAGDRVLFELCQILRTNLRSSDVIARIGGDEFALILTLPPDCKPCAVLGRIQDAISDHPWEHIASTLTVSISVGAQPLDSNATLAEALLGADQLLYQSKSRGRAKFSIAELAAA